MIHPEGAAILKEWRCDRNDESMTCPCIEDGSVIAGMVVLKTCGGQLVVPPDFSDNYKGYQQVFMERLQVCAWLQVAGLNSARNIRVDNRIWYQHRWDRQVRWQSSGTRGKDGARGYSNLVRFKSSAPQIHELLLFGKSLFSPYVSRQRITMMIVQRLPGDLWLPFNLM